MHTNDYKYNLFSLLMAHYSQTHTLEDILAMVDQSMRSLFPVPNVSPTVRHVDSDSTMYLTASQIANREYY